MVMADIEGSLLQALTQIKSQGPASPKALPSRLLTPPAWWPRAAPVKNCTPPAPLLAGVATVS